jgi:hypothetical protein
MKNLRRLIRESIKKTINESMDMGIDGFRYEDELENVFDISHYVIKKIAYDLWPKLGFTKEQEEEIGGIGDSFTPDGSDAFEPVGTMNFYTAGFPSESVDKIVGYIKYILNEKDIKVGEVKYEKVKDKIKPEDFESWGITDGGESLRVVRIPIIENGSGDSGNPPEVNLSNTYAHKIFGEILGFEGDGPYSMDAADLLMKLDSARKQMVARKDIPDTVQHSTEGNIHRTINGKDYYFRTFDKIENFAKWAISKGYRSLHVA